MCPPFYELNSQQKLGFFIMPKKIPKIYFFYSFHTKNRMGIFNPPPLPSEIRVKKTPIRSEDKREREGKPRRRHSNVVMSSAFFISTLQNKNILLRKIIWLPFFYLKGLLTPLTQFFRRYLHLRRRQV